MPSNQNCKNRNFLISSWITRNRIGSLKNQIQSDAFPFLQFGLIRTIGGLLKSKESIQRLLSNPPSMSCSVLAVGRPSLGYQVKKVSWIWLIVKEAKHEVIHTPSTAGCSVPFRNRASAHSPAQQQRKRPHSPYSNRRRCWTCGASCVARRSFARRRATDAPGR